MSNVDGYGSADQILSLLKVVNLTVTGTETINTTEILLGNLALGNATTDGGIISWYKGGTQYNVFSMTTAGLINVLQQANFIASGIRLTGSSTGVTTFTSANSGVTNYTLTFPAATDTLAALGTIQTWTALQTFGNNISIGGAQFSVAALATGHYIYYNGTNWVNVSPITGTTLTETAGQLALNLANANTWTATQTISNATPLIFTNAKNVSIALTAQTVGATTLTIPNFASVSDTFTFVTLAQTLVNKTLTSPTINDATISGTFAGAATFSNILTLSATEAFTASSPFSVANGQTLTFSTTAQSVGAATLIIPNFAGVSDTLAFITLAQTLSNKTLASPVISGSITGIYNIAGTPTLTSTLNLNGQTISGSSTFTGVPSFNAGISFNAAGAIAGTLPYIETDGIGGNLLLNSPTGKLIGAGLNNIQTVAFGSQVVNVYHTNFADANPSTQLGDGMLKLGVGGVSVLDTQIIHSGGFGLGVSTTLVQTPITNSNTGFGLAPSGTAVNAALVIYANSTLSTNLSFLSIDANWQNASAYSIGPVIAGTGTYYPLILHMGPTEAFRITVTPDLQVPTALRMWTGLATSLALTPATGLITTYSKIATVGLGLPAEFASTLTTAVSIGNTSTTIKTYTPTVNGQFLVVISVEASTATTLSTLTVTYTDVTSGVSTTQTLATTVAIGLNAAVTYTALCNASTASAITVSATALAGADLFGSASVFAL